MPGTLVGITPNSPRISAGASGLGSKLSIWLIPPWSQSRMQETSRSVRPPAARARSSRKRGRLSPKTPSEPTRSRSRRVTPSQLRLDPRVSWNIGRSSPKARVLQGLEESLTSHGQPGQAGTGRPGGPLRVLDPGTLSRAAVGRLTLDGIGGDEPPDPGRVAVGWRQ